MPSQRPISSRASANRDGRGRGAVAHTRNRPAGAPETRRNRDMTTSDNPGLVSNLTASTTRDFRCCLRQPSKINTEMPENPITAPLIQQVAPRRQETSIDRPTNGSLPRPSHRRRRYSLLFLMDEDNSDCRQFLDLSAGTAILAGGLARMANVGVYSKRRGCSDESAFCETPYPAWHLGAQPRVSA